MELYNLMIRKRGQGNMSINLRSPEVEIRENRLNSVIAYAGSAKDLLCKSNVSSLECGDRAYSQCSACSLEAATFMVSSITDAALINYGPIGCSGDFSNFNYELYSAGKRRGFQENLYVRAISANIEEKDTIYGAAEKLRSAVYELNDRYRPKAIFVTTTCASGIIGEDIESIAKELEDEIEIPIVPVYCEGFKSKSWATGFDAAFHGALRKIVKPPKKKQEDLINIFNFFGSDVFEDLLGRIGLKPNYLFPMATVEQLETMSEAAASTHICETLGTYISEGLEQEYGVPQVKAPSPYGIEWTDQWLREIGKITNKEELVEKLISEEHEKTMPVLKQLRSKLKSKRVYILSGDTYAHNLGSVCTDLGMEIIGVTTFHHDQKEDNGHIALNSLNALVGLYGEIPNYTVCNKQPYKIVRYLKELNPDIFIVRHEGLEMVGTKIGIITVNAGDANEAIGYSGLIEFGRRLVDAIATKKMVENISKHAKNPYKKWWYEQDDFYFERSNED